MHGPATGAATGAKEEGGGLAGDPAAAAGLALMAVGSLGRGDLAPASDLDLLLVHTGRADVGEVADRLWYPIWDDPMPLDHSVRTPAQVEQAAESDLRVSQGLLDARFLAGDEELGARVVALGHRLWEKRVGKWLPEVMASREASWAAHGDVAFMLEPELQEGRGGLRDLQALALVGRVSPVLAAAGTGGRLTWPQEMLQAVRVELQRDGARRADRLMLEDQERVADALGLGGREEVAYLVAEAGRTVAWVGEDAFRRARSWLTGPGGRRGSADRPVGPGLVLRDNEVTVPMGTVVADDPTLALRAATTAGQSGLPIARQTMARLAEEAPPPPVPWPEAVLRAFINLLATGPGGTHEVETLDQLGIWERYLPEWPRVRNRPQFNPYHRWSVDRHLLETVASAAAHVRRVARPDLLLLGALLHDIGKGAGGDHSELGAVIVEETCRRLGLDPASAGVLEKVVRLHLLLPEVATRRDLEDPATARAVADAVEDDTTLEVLAALAAADGEATGPSAWSDWKAGLVDDLAQRARALLAGRPLPQGGPFPAPDQRRLLEAGGLQVQVGARRLTVVAPDRPGLFSSVAGALALHDIGVLDGRVHSEAGAALEVFTLDVPELAEPRWERVVPDIEAAAGGRLNVGEALARRPAGRRWARRAAPADPTVRVLVDNEGATSATIVEVRAPDAPGALYRITAVLAAEGLDIVSARVATIGGAVVDTFYVHGPDGGPIPDEELGAAAGALEERLRPALAGGEP
jgi:[protein-PII] uridylyltransferase